MDLGGAIWNERKGRAIHRRLASSPGSQSFQCMREKRGSLGSNVTCMRSIYTAWALARIHWPHDDVMWWIAHAYIHKSSESRENRLLLFVVPFIKKFAKNNSLKVLHDWDERGESVYARQESIDTAVRTIGSLARTAMLSYVMDVFSHKWTAGRSSGEPFVSIAPRGKSIANNIYIWNEWIGTAPV